MISAIAAGRTTIVSHVTTKVELSQKVWYNNLLILGKLVRVLESSLWVEFTYAKRVEVNSRIVKLYFKHLDVFDDNFCMLKEHKSNSFQVAIKNKK